MRGRDFNALGSLSSHASAMIGSIRNNLRRKKIENFKSSKPKTEYKKGTIDKKSYTTTTKSYPGKTSKRE